MTTTAKPSSAHLSSGSGSSGFSASGPSGGMVLELGRTRMMPGPEPRRESGGWRTEEGPRTEDGAEGSGGADSEGEAGS